MTEQIDVPTDTHIGWWATCDGCGTNTVLDGDGKGVPDTEEWDQFPNCLVCGGTLHFDEMTETLWNRENRLMRVARENVENTVRELLPEECWVTRNAAIRCTEMIGGVVGTGPHKWTFEMCCLPCQIRYALNPPKPKDESERSTT